MPRSESVCSFVRSYFWNKVRLCIYFCIHVEWSIWLKYSSDFFTIRILEYITSGWHNFPTDFNTQDNDSDSIIRQLLITSKSSWCWPKRSDGMHSAKKKTMSLESLLANTVRLDDLSESVKCDCFYFLESIIIQNVRWIVVIILQDLIWTLPDWQKTFFFKRIK